MLDEVASFLVTACRSSEVLFILFMLMVTITPDGTNSVAVSSYFMVEFGMAIDKIIKSLHLENWFSDTATTLRNACCNHQSVFFRDELFESNKPIGKLHNLWIIYC